MRFSTTVWYREFKSASASPSAWFTCFSRRFWAAVPTAFAWRALSTELLLPRALFRSASTSMAAPAAKSGAGTAPISTWAPGSIPSRSSRSAFSWAACSSMDAAALRAFVKRCSAACTSARVAEPMEYRALTASQEARAASADLAFARAFTAIWL